MQWYAARNEILMGRPVARGSTPQVERGCNDKSSSRSHSRTQGSTSTGGSGSPGWDPGDAVPVGHGTAGDVQGGRKRVLSEEEQVQADSPATAEKADRRVPDGGSRV